MDSRDVYMGVSDSQLELMKIISMHNLHQKLRQGVITKDEVVGEGADEVVYLLGSEKKGGKGVSPGKSAGRKST